MKAIYLVILGVVVFAAVIFRDQKKKSDALKEFEAHAGKSFRMEKCSRYWVLSNLWIFLFCIVVAAYIYFVPESVGPENVVLYIATILSIAVVFGAYVYSEKRFQNLYMNRDSFYHNGTSYRFSSVKSVEQAKRTCKLTTYTGDTININQEKAIVIQNEIYNRKAKK